MHIGCTSLGHRGLQMCTENKSAAVMSFSVIIRFRSIEQALTKSSQQHKCKLGKMPFKSTGEYIVIQLHHWLAVKPLYPDETFEGSLPISAGNLKSLARASICNKLALVKSSFSIQSSNTCFAVSKYKLCIGSITVNLTGSKYGKSSSTE